MRSFNLDDDHFLGVVYNKHSDNDHVRFNEALF